MKLLQKTWVFLIVCFLLVVKQFTIDLEYLVKCRAERLSQLELSSLVHDAMIDVSVVDIEIPDKLEQYEVLLTFRYLFVSCNGPVCVVPVAC